MPVTLEAIERCYFCDEPLGAPAFETRYTDLWDNREAHTFRYRPCERCDLYVLADRPVFGPDLGEFYARKGGCAFLDYYHPNALLRGYTRRLQAEKLAILKRLAPLAPGMRVLEVGSAKGAFAAHLAEQVGCEVHANDLDPAFAEHMPSAVTFHAGEFSAALGREQFDLVVSHQVIEHVYDPRAFLEAAWELLKPGGTLVLETINHRCASFERFGPNWGQLCPPRHTVLFSERFFREQLGAIAPFEAIQVTHDGYARRFNTWVGSALHALHLPLATSAPARGLGAALFMALNPLAVMLDRQLGLNRSIITVTARKPGA